MNLLSRLVIVEYLEIHRRAYEKHLEKPRIEDKPTLVMQVDCEPCWIDPLVWYLKDGQLPENQVEARRIKFLGPIRDDQGKAI